MNKAKMFSALAVAIAVIGGGYYAYKTTSIDRARLTDAQLSAEPFVGVTTDGKLVPDLFPVAATGVSTQAMQDAASAFIATLDDAQKTKMLFAIDALEWRKWSNVDDYTRVGVNLSEMNEAQTASAWTMLDAFLSSQGSTEVRAAMQLNATLGELVNQKDRFNEKLYWFTMMGTPDPKKPWGFQVDGHHVAFNFFVLGDQLSITPAFLGAEPPVAPEGTTNAGLSILQVKQDVGLAFAQSLSAEQLKKAVLSSDKTKDDMVASAFTDNAVMQYVGLSAKDMTPEQKAALLDLISKYANDMEDGHAALWLKKISGHLDDTYFSWIGKTDTDAVFYYRIHSPVILIEFDHETPKPLANVKGYESDVPTRKHAHAITRTPNGNDYGKDWLRQHLAAEH
jgi:Protein of unknown function (DUF3500)